MTFLVLVVLLTGWHASQAGQHLLTDRDPGVYVTTARWLSVERSLLVDPTVGAFEDETALVFEEQGWNLDGEGRLEPQFLHLLPVVLAGAHALGGDGLLFAAPALLAGAALVAFHTYARRLVRPWWATAAAVALGTDLVWVHLSRDAFSEVVAVGLLFTGLTVLREARRRASPPAAFVAGLALGAVATARVEGFVALIPLLAYAAAELVAAQGRPAGERAATGRLIAALVGGTVVTIGVALADLALFSTWYLDDLAGLLLAVAGAALLTVVGGATAVALAVRHRRRVPGDRGVSRALARRRRRVATIAAAVTVAVFLGLWFVRPAVSTSTGPPSAAIADIEAQEGRPSDGVRRYSEDSFVWLSWYLGPVALAAGVAGAAVVVHRIVRSADVDLAVVPFAVVFAAITLLYLWRPSIVPDQIWAMRRFAVVTIPGFALLGAVAGQAAQDGLRAAGRTTLALVAPGALVLAAVGAPVATLVPVRGATTQAGMLGAVGEVCDAVGDDGAVVVVAGAALERIAGQALRAFCGVPVATTGPSFDRGDVERLDAAWAMQGRTLHLVGADRSDVEGLAGTSAEAVVVAANDEVLEATLVTRPDELVARPFTFVVADAGP